MNLAPIVKAVRAYDATEWEIFVREWQKGLQGYAEVKRLGAAGDHGRDVVGLYTSAACEGPWDNFQCKHYDAPLATPKACEDAGKIIFHAFNKVFAPPKKCIFVAPRGPSTDLRDKLLNPSKFREEMLNTWDARVAKKMISGETHSLVGSLKDYVEAYNFESFGYRTLDEILDDHRRTAFWAQRFGGLLPDAPAGVTPAEIAPSESVYVNRLLEVYTDLSGKVISTTGDLTQFPQHVEDLQKQRVRFYDAEAFVTHYRDQTEPGTVEDFADQIFDTVDSAILGKDSSIERLSSALTAASGSVPASVLNPKAKIRVKQGVCHQLANEGRIRWRPQ